MNRYTARCRTLRAHSATSNDYEREMMKTSTFRLARGFVFVGGLLALLISSAGCDEEKALPAPETAAAVAPALPEKTAEEKAAEEKAAAEEAKRKEEAAQAEAELAKNPLTECCRALGQKGFTMRSPEYMAASKVCATAMEAEKKLDSITADVEKELKGKELPAECKAK